MSGMQFNEKFVGFVDVLGFKDMVRAAESGTGMSLPTLLGTLKELGTTESRNRYVEYGPTTCPCAPYVQKDLDFRVTQISDCVIVSSEISPAGVINLVSHCWGAVINLLPKGIMCRGYITRGSIYHSNDQVIGTGYQNAFEKERGVSAFKREADERGTPFVEVDPAVCDYIKNHGDHCVREMFARMVKSDGSATALFPFQRLSHSFMIGGFGVKYDPEVEKRSVQTLRVEIRKFKERVIALTNQSDPSAVRKANHYIAALDAQLVECDQTDEMIDQLEAPYPSA